MDDPTFGIPPADLPLDPLRAERMRLRLQRALAEPAPVAPRLEGLVVLTLAALQLLWAAEVVTRA